MMKNNLSGNFKDGSERALIKSKRKWDNLFKRFKTVSTKPFRTRSLIERKEQCLNSTIAIVTQAAAKIQTSLHFPNASEPSTIASSIKTRKADDSDVAVFVDSYVEDIYSYLINYESRLPIFPGFLAYQKGITTNMRARLVNWMVEVHLCLRFIPETLHTAVSILNRFLQANVPSQRKILLVGASVLFVAAKYEETKSPKCEVFIKVLHNAFSIKDFLKMEKTILTALNFRLGKPTPLDFVSRYSLSSDEGTLVGLLSDYIIELSYLYTELCSCPPSLLAASALSVSRDLLSIKNQSSSCLQVDKKDEIGCSYFTFYEVVRKLRNVLMSAPAVNLQNIQEKYSSRSYKRVSVLPELMNILEADVLLL